MYKRQVNDDKFLPNDKGNRRFVVLQVNGKFPTKTASYTHVRKTMQEQREQLWAEAMALWKKGYKLVEPENLEQILDVGRDRHRIKNLALEQAIFEAVAHLKTGPSDTGLEDALTAKGKEAPIRIRVENRDGLSYFRMLDLIQVMPNKFRSLDNTYQQMEIADILKEDGFIKEKKTINNKSANWWHWPLETNPPF